MRKREREREIRETENSKREFENTCNIKIVLFPQMRLHDTYL